MRSPTRRADGDSWTTPPPRTSNTSSTTGSCTSSSTSPSGTWCSGTWWGGSTSGRGGPRRGWGARDEGAEPPARAAHRARLRETEGRPLLREGERLLHRYQTGFADRGGSLPGGPAGARGDPRPLRRRTGGGWDDPGRR